MGDKLLGLFLMFLKINLLTTSGLASVGLLHEEAVAGSRFASEEEFIGDFG